MTLTHVTFKPISGNMPIACMVKAMIQFRSRSCDYNHAVRSVATGNHRP